MLLAACSEKWTTTIESNYKGTFDINEEIIEEYQIYKDSDSTCAGIPLEIALYQNGIEVIDMIDITDLDGDLFSLDEEDIIKGICVSPDGSFQFNDQSIVPASVYVRENNLVNDAKRIQDVTATAAAALGLEMEGLGGTSLVTNTYKHVVLLFLDGFSYRTYKQASSEGLIPNIETDAAIFQAITIYPPRTTTSSAALLTGVTPNENGVYKSGIRSTEARTLFDAALEKGIQSVAIEGESLAFNLRNTTAVLSGDRDQNGGTDDNTFANALETLETGVPDLVWIHFHGIDDLGHAYGPVTGEVLNKVVEVDAYVGQIYEILPENTLIIIFSDHGMHYEKEEEEYGNHGNLIYDDMVIPIFIQTK
jgi:hypothetical protein